MLYMADLKLYAKDNSELEGLLRIVKGFSDKATFKKGKLEKSDHARLDETIIKDLEQEKVYNTLALMSLVEFNSPNEAKTKKRNL